MSNEPRVGPGATPSATPAMAQADTAKAMLDKMESAAEAPASEPATELTLPPVKGSMSGAPPMSKVLDTETLELIRATIRQELEEDFAAREPSREQIEDMSIPFNNHQLQLAVFADNPNDPIPGMHLRWINDEGDRIRRHQVKGYAFVKNTEIAIDERITSLNKDLGEYVSVYVGTQAGGAPMRAYLMKMPVAQWEKLQKLDQRQNDAIDQAIRRGTVGNPGSNAYVPKDTPIRYDPQHRVIRELGRTSS